VCLQVCVWRQSQCVARLVSWVNGSQLVGHLRNEEKRSVAQLRTGTRNRLPSAANSPGHKPSVSPSIVSPLRRAHNRSAKRASETPVSCGSFAEPIRWSLNSARGVNEVISRQVRDIFGPSRDLIGDSRLSSSAWLQLKTFWEGLSRSRRGGERRY